MIQMFDEQLLRIWGYYFGGLGHYSMVPNRMETACGISGRLINYQNYEFEGNGVGWCVDWIWPLEKGGSETYNNLFISHTSVRRVDGHYSDTEGTFSNGTEYKVERGHDINGKIVGVLYVKVNGEWILPYRPLG